MAAEGGFRLGIVEGFFGRQWSWQARREQVRFLAGQGFGTYLYAPKNDAFLRKRWFEPYPAAELAALSGLAAAAAVAGLEFGIGLSPFELYLDFSAQRREALLRKIDQLNQLQAPLLAVLFDDMLGNLPGLAERQLQIFDVIHRHSAAQQFALCPTYYSDDPSLLRHFGPSPADYLEELGAALPAEIAIFWTGPRVISDEYPREHLLEVGRRLRRKPLLWDNYPVNDAKRLTGFLHLAPFAQRAQGRFDFAALRSCCSGLLSNPMNQAALSRVPLASLAALAGVARGEPAIGSPVVLRLLAEDAAQLQHTGLEQLPPAERGRLLERYRACLPDAMAEEVCEWLEGAYAFDPACLT